MKPTQLYLNASKIAKVREFYTPLTIDSLPPIPIAKLNTDIIITDGHTRTYVAYIAGLDEINAFWDSLENTDIQEYIIRLNWCKEAGIKAIFDLSSHIVRNTEYKALWLNRYKALHNDVKKKTEIDFDMKI